MNYENRTYINPNNLNATFYETMTYYYCSTGNNSFSWLKNKKIIRIEDYYNYDEDVLAEGNIDQLRKCNNPISSKNNTLRFGQYKDGNDFRFTLILRKPNEYVFKFRNFILSEGAFSSNKKEVMLYDTSLQHNFYLFINGNELENIFFP